VGRGLLPNSTEVIVTPGSAAHQDPTAEVGPSTVTAVPPAVQPAASIRA
jgi:hypothetical protein